MKGGGSREPQPFPSVDPFSTSLLSNHREYPAGDASDGVFHFSA